MTLQLLDQHPYDRTTLRAPSTTETARRRWMLSLVAGLLLFAWVGIPAADHEPGLIQVQLTPGASIAAVNATYGTTTVDSLPPHYLLRVPPGVNEDMLIAQMSADPGTFICVEHSFRDETPEGVRQMVVTAVGGTIGDYLDQGLVERIRLPEVHAYSTGEGTLVAVLDTGVLATHEALSGAIAPGGYDFVDDDDDPTDAGNGIDDDGDRLIDEGAGHGTLVAGIIHLVAPGARLLPIRVLDDEGRGTTFTLAKGIRYATEMGADVINLSLGLTDRSGIIAHELAQARLHAAAMVGAAGNLGSDSLLYYPASDVKVLMVAALDSADVKAEFSNYHARVAVSAPGVGILGPYYDGGYAIGAGTSFATPFIAGQCALIRAMVPGISWDDLYIQALRGVVDIYSIPENQPYVGELGTGRFDGLETLLTTLAPSAVPSSPGVPTAPRSTVPAVAALHVAPSVLLGGRPALLTWDAPRGASDTRGGVLRVVDIGGRLVGSRSLAVAEGAAGALRWDGRDASGRLLPSGSYLLDVTSGGSAYRAKVYIVR